MNENQSVVVKKETNWLVIALIIGAIWFFTQQKGCDLSNILPKSVEKTKDLDIKEPPNQYKSKELASFQVEVAKNKKKAAYLAAFYFGFADILSRNSDVFNTTQEFRQYHSGALDLMFKNDPELDSPELGQEIEDYLQKYISTQPKTLTGTDKDTIKNCFLALAWAANNENN